MSKHSPNCLRRSVATVAAGVCATPFLAGFAQNPAPAPGAAEPPPNQWENRITAGLTLARGNNDSVQATVAVETKKKWNHDDLTIFGQFGYGETTDKNADPEVTTKSDDYLTAGIQWNHLFTPRFYGGLKGDYRHDDVADLNYRFTISPLAGYYFIKTDRDILVAEAGPSYIWEEQGGEKDDYMAVRFAERYEHKFSDKARLWESVEYLPDVEDWVGKYIINAELGIETSVTKALSLRVVAQDVYDSDPAAGRQQNDFRIIAGLTYSFKL